MNVERFDHFYGELSQGEKQHLANRMYLRDNVMPQRVKRELIELQRLTDVTIEHLFEGAVDHA